MEIDVYYKKAKEFANYPKSLEEEYLFLGLNGEVGEVADKMKKLIRDEGIDITMIRKPSDSRIIEVEVIKGILLELGDVMWYLIMTMAYEEPEDVRILPMAIALFEHDQKNLFWQMQDLVDSVRKKLYRRAIMNVKCIATLLGYSLWTVLEMNIEKLQDRKNRNKINGSGDYR